MQTYDQLNLPSIAAAEQIARRVLMTERAVRKNPKNPEFDGLELYLSHSLDSSGGVVLRLSINISPSSKKWMLECGNTKGCGGMRLGLPRMPRPRMVEVDGNGTEVAALSHLKPHVCSNSLFPLPGLGVGAGSATCAGRRAGRRLAVRRR
eukprot:5633306-Amphidinium_carterae.1